MTWREALGPILMGLAALVTAVAGVLRTRVLRGFLSRLARSSSRLERQLIECEDERDRDRETMLAAMRHLDRLERILAGRGVPVPPRPTILA